MSKTQSVVEHAGSGFLMPEAMAKRIDDLSRSLPKDFTYRRVAKAPAEFSAEPGERTDVSFITTNAKDRDGEVVVPSGIDASTFNRVVPFCHDYKSLPVGSCLWMKPKATSNGSGIIAKTQYAVKPPDWGDHPWMPSAILHLMQQSVPTCTGKSIGFLPLNVRAATPEEKAANPDSANSPVIDKCKLLEYSVCPIACNPEAEMLAVSKGIKSGFFDTKTADMLLNAMQPYLISPLEGNAMTKFEEHASQKAGGKFAHIDFTAPALVRNCMSKGLDAHTTMGHDCATPEQLAMASHMAGGGKCSPQYAMKMMKWHGANPQANAQPEGGPAHTLAMLHGGNTGPAWSAKMCKDMDDAGMDLSIQNPQEDTTNPTVPNDPAMPIATGTGLNPGQTVSVKKDMKEAGCVMAPLPEHLKAMHKSMTEKIPQTALAKGGREDDPHVTCLWGIKGAKPEQVAKCLDGVGPLKMTIGKSAHFPATADRPSDIVHCSIDSPDIEAVNQKLKSLPHVMGEPFAPHMTLAYVHAGKGKDYSGMSDMESQQATVDTLDFGDESGTTHRIALTGKAAKVIKSFKTTFKAMEDGDGGDEVEDSMMPPCPDCGTNIGVTQKDDGATPDMMTCSCEYCGKEFQAKPPVLAVKEVKGVELNRPGFEAAMGMIDAGKVSGDPWSFTSADRATAKPEHYLGTDGAMAPDTEGHWKYPIIKDGMVYRRGVAAAESRAGQNAPTIADAAQKLMAAIQTHEAESKKAKAIDLACAASSVTAAAKIAALNREAARLKAELPELVRSVLREEYDLIRGRT